MDFRKHNLSPYPEKWLIGQMKGTDDRKAINKKLYF